jgi:hypothetical protein
MPRAHPVKAADGLPRRQRLHRIAPGKQPASWLRHLPPGPQQIEEVRRVNEVISLSESLSLRLLRT